MSALRVFCTVADTGSFVAAARTFDLSRAAVTKHVVHLEDRLGVRLLERTTRRVRLTEAGVRFRAHCARVLAELDDAEREASALAVRPSGMLRLSAPCSFATAHVVPFVVEFHRAYPEVTLEVRQMEGLPNLLEENLDLAICIASKLQQQTLVVRRLATARFVVCAAPAYLAHRQAPRTPEDLCRHACLGYWPATPDHRWSFLCADERRYTVPVHEQLRSNGTDILRAAAIAGAGVTLLPTFMVGEDLRAGRLRALLTQFRLPELGIFAAYPSRRHLPLKVKAFVDFLAATYGPRPYWDRWLDELPAPSADACAACATLAATAGGAAPRPDDATVLAEPS